MMRHDEPSENGNSIFNNNTLARRLVDLEKKRIAEKKKSKEPA
jgi:hypothetical protein